MAYALASKAMVDNLAEPDSSKGSAPSSKSGGRSGAPEMPVVYGLSDETMREILTTVRTIAVVGASPNPARPSNEVLGFLIDEGFETYPVNPWHAGGLIRGRPTYARLADVPARSTWSTSFAIRPRLQARSTTRSTSTRCPP